MSCDWRVPKRKRVREDQNQSFYSQLVDFQIDSKNYISYTKISKDNLDKKLA